MNTKNANNAQPRFTGITPVVGIRSYETAVAFYVDWLGFHLDWEWRAAPGKPVIMAISRDGVSIMLNEDDERSIGSWLSLSVQGIQALADEWSAKRPGAVSVIEGPPYEIPEVHVTDPFGNRLVFQQPISPEEEAARKARAPRMRDYIRQRLAEGAQLPTPEEVVHAVGRPIGMAMDILCEFPEYNQK